MNWLERIQTRGAAALICLLGISAQKATAPYFREVPAAESKVHWRHNNGRSAMRYLPETMSGGAAILDYDNDGWMDLLFTDTGSSSFYKPSKPAGVVLFRNDGRGAFQDVTAKAGLQFDQFSHGGCGGRL